MSGSAKNPFGGGSFKAGDQSTANIFGPVSQDANQNKGIIFEVNS